MEKNKREKSTTNRLITVRSFNLRYPEPSEMTVQNVILIIKDTLREIASKGYTLIEFSKICKIETEPGILNRINDVDRHVFRNLVDKPENYMWDNIKIQRRYKFFDIWKFALNMPKNTPKNTLMTKEIEEDN